MPRDCGCQRAPTSCSVVPRRWRRETLDLGEQRRGLRHTSSRKEEFSVIQSDARMELDELAPLGGSDRGAERRIGGLMIAR